MGLSVVANGGWGGSQSPPQCLETDVTEGWDLGWVGPVLEEVVTPFRTWPREGASAAHTEVLNLPDSRGRTGGELPLCFGVWGGQAWEPPSAAPSQARPSVPLRITALLGPGPGCRWEPQLGIDRVQGKRTA